MTQISVSVDDEHLTQIESVAATLRTHGMQVEQVLGELGLITGSIAEDRQQTLAACDGVSSVDTAQGVQLSPPDSPLQ